MMATGGALWIQDPDDENTNINRRSRMHTTSLSLKLNHYLVA
jgi:hypothetical protein